MKLAGQRCRHNATALSIDAATALLAQVPAWHIDGDTLVREFAFADYHETIAFVNALAWMIHQRDHHPDLMVSYKLCAVSYTTHSAGGELSLNDFICAARVSALYVQRAPQ